MRREVMHHTPLSTETERMHAALTEDELHAAKTSDLAKTLADRMLLLARKEVELARAEAQVDLRRGLYFGGLAGGAGVFLIASLCCALVCAILAIGLAWNPIWVALIGFGIFLALGVGVGLVAAGEAQELRPKRSIRQAKETVHFVREPLST